MKPVFVDSSYIIAFLAAEDAHHKEALHYATTLRRRLVTTKWILVEVGGYFRTQPYRDKFLVFVNKISSEPDWQVLAVSDESFEAGLKFYASRTDKGWSLADCISFTVMQELGLTDALTTDHHFEQAGFNALLR